MFDRPRAALPLALLLTGVLALPTAAGASPGLAEDDRAVAAFERFKALEGRWHADSTKGWSEEVTIEVIARGSVVMFTTHFDEGRKMVTMYSMDGDRLVATHYCEARNQPHLVASEIAEDSSSVLLSFERGGNIASRDQGHMDKAHIRFLGEDRFASRWTWYQDGTEDWMEEIQYQRVR